MLQLPDFIEKQIVIINPREGISLNDVKFKNENIVLYRDGKLENQVSIHKVLSLFIFGEMTLTSQLIKKAQKYGVSLFLLNNNFEQYAGINAMAEGNYVLRNNQYHFNEELEFSRNLVKNKTFNQLTLLKENCPDFFKGKTKLSYYKSLCKKIDESNSLDSLRGLEGNMSKQYFGEYFKELKWYKRMPRSKIDITNVLLDIGYNMLFNLVDSLLKLHGFDTYKGIYHQLFFQRKSLSCDLMEPFRVIIDKALVKAFHLKQIDDADFTFYRGQYSLNIDKNGKYTRIFLDAIMDSKEDIFTYIKAFYFCMLNGKQDYPFFELKC